MSELSFLDSLEISDEQVNSPYFGIVFGPPGCGKSWLCRFAPNPFYIATEKGVEKVPNIGKFIVNKGTDQERVRMPENLDQFFDMARYFITTNHDYKTIVIDSGKFVDKLIIDDVIKNNPTETIKKVEVKVESIGDYNFGKGYSKALSQWNKFLTAVDFLNKKGINVILIAHSHDKNVQNLSGEDYKKQKIDMLEFGNFSAPALLSAKADFVYYMRSESKTRNVTSNFGASKTIATMGSNPDIMLYTRSQSGFDAKVRTSKKDNIPDYYKINLDDDESSKQVFLDLEK